MALPSLTWSFQTTLPKYPSAESKDCSEVKSWQSNWSCPKKSSRENHLGLVVVTQFNWCSLIFHFATLTSRICKKWRRESKRHIETCVIFILRFPGYRQVFLNSAGILWKEPALWFWTKMEWEAGDSFLKVTPRCPILPHLSKLSISEAF